MGMEIVNKIPDGCGWDVCGRRRGGDLVLSLVLLVLQLKITIHSIRLSNKLMQYLLRAQLYILVLVP